MLKKSRINQSGFSLIELMVVVAIIGILAAIGIPQYSKFQAKTRQSEAKSSLSTLYASEASFMGEWNTYSIDLKNIWFGVSGSKLRYVTGFNTGLVDAGTQTACFGYPAAATGVPTEVANRTNTLSSGQNVNVVGPTQAIFAFVPPVGTAANVLLAGSVPPACAAAVTANCHCSGTPGSQNFTAVSVGDPNANVGTTALDGWTINSAKVLSNSTAGIN